MREMGVGMQVNSSPVKVLKMECVCVSQLPQFQSFLSYQRIITEESIKVV